MEMSQTVSGHLNHAISLRIPENLTSGYKSGKSDPVMVLNASPDTGLRGTRARFLNSAGYYTSSAGTLEDIKHLASQMKCAVAIMCHSFTGAERRTMHEQLRKVSPATRIVSLDVADCDPRVFLARVKEALAGCGSQG